MATPYLAFALLWGAAFGTVGHLRWTLIHVVFGDHAGEIAVLPDIALVNEAVAPYLALLGLGLLRAALSPRRLRSPLVPVALAAFGMAWPRWGLLHLAAAQGLLVLAALRGLRLLPPLARRLSRSGASRRRGLLAAIGTALVLMNAAVAVVGAGPLLLDAAGEPARSGTTPGRGSGRSGRGRSRGPGVRSSSTRLLTRPSTR